jgi:hypothetical protein
MASRLEAHSKTEGNNPASLRSQEFLNRFPDRFFHQLPFFHLISPYLSAITRAEKKGSHNCILLVYYKKSNNYKNKCSKRPQKRAPSNAAFHPTIETVGFQAAFSVSHLLIS